MWAAIVIIVIALLLVLTAPKPKIENARAANLGDFQFPRSKEGDPLQWFLGTIRAKSPNSLWYGDYTPVPIKKKQKTGMFSSKKVIVGYEYHVGLDLCFGIGGDKPVTLRRLWSDKYVFWSGVQSVAGTLTVNLPNLFGGPEQRGGLVGSIDYYPGTFDQTRNAYLVAKADPEVPAYIGQCHLVFRGSTATKASGFYFGVTTNVNAISAELTRLSSNVHATYSVMPNGLDVNPMEFMHAAFTEKFGMPGVSLDDIDMPSWVRDAETLYNEGMGMSLQVQQGITGKDLAEEALRIADGILYQDQNTGKIKSRLIRQDYDIEDLLVLDESIVEALTNFSKTTWAQTYNQCRVTFKDRETDYADKAAMAQDFANINFQQRVKNTDISVPGCFVSDQANQLAVRQLSLLSVPLFQIEIQCNRRASNLEPGDCFVFNYLPYGLSNMVMRVQKIDKGTLTDGVVTINAVQDRFATATAVFAPPSGSGWVPISNDAAPVSVRRMEELPYWFAQFLDIAIDDTTQGLVAALAVPPASASAFFDVDATTSADTTYADAVQALVDAPYYGGGILISDYLESVGRTDGYDATGFDLELVDVPLELVDGGGTLDRSGPMLLLMNGEFMLAENITDNGDETYTFSEIRRALLDTRFQDHDAGDRCWIVKQSDDIMEVLFSNTGSFRARFIDNTPSDTLPVADATQSTFTLTQRMERPAPPDYVTINGSRAPSSADGGTDITLAWRARNRLTESLVLYDDAAEAAEASTDYGWRYRIDGGAWSAFTYVSASPQVITAPAELGIAEFEVVSRRDGLQSATADNVFIELTEAAPSTALRDSILATPGGPPTWFCEHNETVLDTVAVNIGTGADGTYSPYLGAKSGAIFTGGSNCWNNTGLNWCDIPSTCLPEGSSSFTLEIMVNANVLSNYGALIDRDPESGGRWWQWRVDSSGDQSLIQIVSGITSATGDGFPSTGVTVLLGARYDSATGVMDVLLNGTVVGTNSPGTGLDFGDNTYGLRVLRRIQGDSAANYKCAASIVYDYAVPDADMLDHAVAAGLV